MPKLCLDIASETENLGAQGEACCALGVIHNKKAEYDKAVDYFERNFEIARTLASNGHTDTAHVDLSRVYLGMGRGNQMLNQYVNVINHTYALFELENPAQHARIHDEPYVTRVGGKGAELAREERCSALRSESGPRTPPSADMHPLRLCVSYAGALALARRASSAVGESQATSRTTGGGGVFVPHFPLFSSCGDSFFSLVACGFPASLILLFAAAGQNPRKKHTNSHPQKQTYNKEYIYNLLASCHSKNTNKKLKVPATLAPEASKAETGQKKGGARGKETAKR